MSHSPFAVFSLVSRRTVGTDVVLPARLRSAGGRDIPRGHLSGTGAQSAGVRGPAAGVTIVTRRAQLTVVSHSVVETSLWETGG